MLTIVVWDVQHGSASYIKTPNGKHIAIDLGVGSYGVNNDTFSPLLYLQNRCGVNQLDEVIITHPHTDHIDDIFNFNKLSPKILRSPRHLSEDDIRQGNPSSDKYKVDAYLEIINGYTQNLGIEEDPELTINNGGVKFYCFTPTNCSRSNLNNHSIVTIIEYLGIKVLIPGDNQVESWNELLEKPGFIDAIKNIDIFIASHHGRKNGFHSDLFKHFNPDLVIVSDGAETDTSAVDSYSKLAKGWKVHKSGGEPETRNCLTTRKDNTIFIEIGKNNDGGKFMQVTI